MVIEVMVNHSLFHLQAVLITIIRIKTTKHEYWENHTNDKFIDRRTVLFNDHSWKRESIRFWTQDSEYSNSWKGWVWIKLQTTVLQSLQWLPSTPEDLRVFRSAHSQKRYSDRCVEKLRIHGQPTSFPSASIYFIFFNVIHLWTRHRFSVLLKYYRG
jgi:hypothetical protein